MIDGCDSNGRICDSRITLDNRDFYNLLIATNYKLFFLRALNITEYFPLAYY